MTTALATVDTDRLAKLIRLIFGSDRDGEIVAAVAAVRRILASGNVDAHWLADRLAAPAIVGVAKERQRDDGHERSLIWFAWHRRDFLTPKEQGFIGSLTRWHGPISERQRQWLNAICDKLAEVAA
jgi:hypothetical protein